MKCPTCNQPMKRLNPDMSSNPATGKQYDRTIYQCPTDDTWITVEMPQAAKN